VVAGAGSRTAPPPGATAPGAPYLVELEPPTLMLTCERVRQALNRELQLPEAWRGQIYVVINPRIPINQPPVIAAQGFTSGWHYRMESPPWIEPAKLVRALVQVLLLETANRGAQSRSAEIPLWFSEGITQHLIHSTLLDLVVQPPNLSSDRVPARSHVWERVRPDPLAAARERLASHAAFSFSRMGEIEADGLPEETWKTFQASAHVFVHHLLQWPGAFACAANMLDALPHYLNWQTAFLGAFQPLFPSLLEVEKWWSVVLVQFTGLDPLNAWPLEVALAKLDELLHPPVLVSSSPSNLARRQRFSLQQIVEHFDEVRQRILLQGVAGQLTAVRLRMPPEVATLTDQYRRVIADYLERRLQSRLGRAVPNPVPLTPNQLSVEARKALDRLDQRRLELVSQPSPSTHTPPNQSP
jgi:hypothetical protein